MRGAPRAASAKAARPATRVLVVDDEESMRHFVTKCLRRAGYEVTALDSGAHAAAEWAQSRYDLAVVDLKMPGPDGLAVLGQIRASSPDAVVLLMTGYGSIATAVEAMKLGATDYVTKPFAADELCLRIERALELRRARSENHNLRTLLEKRDEASYGGLIGKSPAMQEVYRTLELLRGSNATVLICGEPGTGKGLVARALHATSDRAGEAFVTLHCPTPPEALFDSEVFGHELGAFTGARQARRGLIARADRGTLFLDEVSELGPAAQAKLERFLQEREFTTLGGTEPVHVDVRVIAATNLDLRDPERRAALRKELLWRLDVVRVDLPPLRERREDIPLLATHQLEQLAARGGVRRTLTADAVALLAAYDWPGNVRQLENVIERMVVLAGDREVLGVGDLPEELRGNVAVVLPAATYADAAERFERQYLQGLLARCNGNVSEVARLAGISRGHLHRRLRDLALDAAGYRRI